MAGLISPSPVSFLQGGGGSGGGGAAQQQQYNLNMGVLPQVYQQHQQRAGTIGLGGGLGGGVGGAGGGVNVNLSYSDSPSLPAHLSHQQANQYMNAFQGGGLGLPVGVGGMGTVGLNAGGVGGITGVGPGHEEGKLFSLVIDLMDPNARETALLELSKKREQWDDLAMVLWHSFGIMPALLQEIVSVYPLLSPPNLTAHVSNRVCNALALLQCVASHSETRQLFLNAHIPLFLYPFLNTTSKTRPFEYLRLTSLGVIGALVKQNDNSTVIHFLLSTEIIPLCLRIMETGSELSKTVAIFIVQKILLDETGLTYICHTYERFYAVGTVLSNMVNQLVETQAVRLLKHVVRCYLRLSDNPRAREALRACLPEPLRDNTFSALLKGDMVTKRCLTTLLNNLNELTNH
ncbi:cell differentiation family, Rcd1-like-domain-containing protein [Thelephora terrestris]|uniref:Cell differentiation family, Rcd1-like-domain-containing protein n=1 Tax=Thelephora terrestris TaxID=56493 RepID=A0A9P6HHJ9_9AGAM|nr:cell differentiation family, Rcd1-like-domain-containing protein [Thelephora terrestris]